jgi:hypothetical protein
MIALLRFWKQGLLGLLLLAFALMWASKAAIERQNGKLKQQLAEASRMIVRIEEQVRARTEQARMQDLANAAQAERHQQEISREIANDYQTRLGDLRRRYDAIRMRTGEARADPGSRGNPDLPGVSPAAAGTDAPSGENGLPPADALIASEQALQLKALQEWVRGQAGTASQP